MAFISAAIGGLFAVLVAGCATAPVVSQVAPEPDLGPSDPGRHVEQAREMVRQRLGSSSLLTDSANKDYVLDNMLLAKTAVDANDWPVAKQCLRRIIAFYETTSVGQQKAGQASLAEKEIHRFFRGEPYERSFVYFLYGLAHLMEGDSHEAGRSFYTAIAADAAFAEQFSHDNALFYYFLGLALQEKGDTGNAAGAYANCVRLLRTQGQSMDAPQLRVLGFNADPTDRERSVADVLVEANVILLVESGYSPNKATTGSQNQLWNYYTLPCRAKAAAVTVDGRPTGRTVSLCDTAYQATTGGRSGDKVALQDIKAFAKSATIFVPYGGGFLSTFWEVEGDKRTWANLPQYYQVCALHVEQPEADVLIDFIDGRGNPIRNLSQLLRVPVAQQGFNVVTASFHETRN